MKVPKYIKDEIRKGNRLAIQQRLCSNKVADWLLSQGVDLGEHSELQDIFADIMDYGIGDASDLVVALGKLEVS